jgi:hypothetical protein
MLKKKNAKLSHIKWYTLGNMYALVFVVRLSVDFAIYWGDSYETVEVG